ncbi:hypothetical protein [Micromonospora sp. LOL_015]|uniref:hypothetical protein n=1 Tax=Micromonospora sp. LOL_015 TaxID=3345416 RepID=UPI003A893734
MRVFWLHLRTSPARWALPVLIALDLAVLFLRSRYWVGVWPETGAAAQVPAYLLGPLAAGAAAWAASTPARHRVHEQLGAARTYPATREAYRLGATAFIFIIPYLIGQAIAFILTARTFPPGFALWLGYALLGVFVLLACVGLGWAVGQHASSTFGALIATLGTLILIGLLARWFHFVVVSGRSEMTVHTLGLGLRLGAVVLLLAALCCIPVRAGRTRPYASALTVALLLLAGAVVATPAAELREPAGDRAVCVGTSSQFCIWPEQEKYIPHLRELSERAEALPDSFTVPPRLNAFGVEQFWAVDPHGKVYLSLDIGPPTFYILEGSPWSYAGDTATAIMGATFEYRDVDDCAWYRMTDTDRARLEGLRAWLESYLVGNVLPDYQTNAPAEILQAWAVGWATAELPLPEQFAWAESEVRELRGDYCGS